MRKKLKMKNFFTAILALTVIFSLHGCAGQPSGKVYTKDGREYGRVKGTFRHRWWSYYERGVSFIDGEFYAEAVDDFKAAIRQREADQRMARTYGMHFVDYFPHRELGVVYYEMRNLTAAKQELELSLAQFPTAKARFYLDRVRKSLLDRSKPEATAPQIRLGYKDEEIWTRQDPVILSGVAEDDKYVAAVKIAGIPVFLEGSSKEVAFERDLKLDRGRHEVVVEARNLLGKSTQRRLVFHVDREGPVITLEGVQRSEKDTSVGGNTYIVTGSAYDESHVHEVTINGIRIPVERGEEAVFKQTVPSGRDLELVARDRLGNQTTAVIPAAFILSGQRSRLLASAGISDTSFLLAGLFGPKDKQAPDIQLKGWTDKQTVFLEKVYIEGQARDEKNIVGLTINQRSILRRKGQTIFFSHLVELDKGPNEISIEARDKSGNVNLKKIIIERQVPKALQLEERLSLTVMPFEQKGNVSDAGLSFQDNLTNSLVGRNRFRMIERNQLEMILREQELSSSKLVDRETALKMGKLVAARAIITGSFVETSKGIEIVARMIDTETSEILETEDVYAEARDLMTLRTLAEGLAIKLHLDFPLLEGLVVQQKGGYIITDLGQDKIKIQRRLIVYRKEQIKHPVTGKVMGADYVDIGRARVSQVMADMSKARISKRGDTPIKPLDRVITE
ncbi:CsgG/HfaB family protein [Thermodesulfobacteriota bacterium]